MEKITWNQTLVIGIPEIDSQHQSFVDIINRLIDLQGEIGNEDLTEIFTDLTDYASEHLVFEEQLLEKYGYPDLEHHKEEHEQAALEFSNIMLEAVNNQNRAIDELLVLLKNWFEHHMLEDDMAYRQFLIEKGIIKITD